MQRKRKADSANLNRVWTAKYIALAVLLFTLFCFRSGSVPLFDLDEGLYVSCARVMAISGDFITPRLNTHVFNNPTATTVPFFEKPILVYWSIIGAMRLCGISEWAARLPAALAALLTTWAILLVGTRWFGRRAGLYAGLIFATSPLTVLDAREITPDGLLVLFMTGILLVFHRIYERSNDEGSNDKRSNDERSNDEGANRDQPLNWMDRAGLPALFWTLCALAALTKGIVGLLLPALIICCTLLLDRITLHVRVTRKSRPTLNFALKLRSRSQWLPVVRSLRPLPGLLLLLILVLPWFVLISRAGERDALGHTFVQEYIIRQHIGRFKGLDAVHNLPLPSYLLFFLIGFFPWACITPAAFRLADGLQMDGSLHTGQPKTVLPRPEQTGAPLSGGGPEPDRHRFLLIWFWAVFLFFSLAAAKLPTYIAPAYPAAALLVGRWLDRVLDRGAPPEAMRSLRRGAMAATLIAAMLLAVAYFGPHFAPRNAPIPDDIRWLALTLILVLTLGSGLSWASYRYARTPARGLQAGFGIQVGMLTLLTFIGCTAGYAVATRDILQPYQRAAAAAGPDAAHGIPVVFYNIVPRRPSMLYYGGYSPYEHKEPGLLPFLKLALPASTPKVDLVLSRSSYEHLLLPELASVPAIQVTVHADYGNPGSDWLLVRLESRTGITR